MSDALPSVAPDEFCPACATRLDPLTGRCPACGDESDTNASAFTFDADPPAPAGMRLEVHRLLGHYAEQLGVEFYVGENRIETAQVFQPEAMMPIIALDAMRIWQDISVRPGQRAFPMEDSLHTEFIPTTGAFFPVAAHPDAVRDDPSATLRMLVFLLATRRVLGLRPNQKVDLLMLIRTWDKIDWESPTLPELPRPPEFDAKLFQHEFEPLPTLPGIAPTVNPTPATPIENRHA